MFFNKFTPFVTTTYLTDGQLKDVIGTYVTTEGCHVIDRSVHVINDKGDFVARFVKSCLPLELQRNARPGLLRASGDFSNRASFVGRGWQMNRIRKDGTLSERRGVPRSILKSLGRTGFLGYFDYRDKETGKVSCRQTSWTLDDFTAFEGAIPLMRHVGEVFRQACPEGYAAQMVEVAKIKAAYRIGALPWSTSTVNINSRASVHTDVGDLKHGTAALTADGDFQGSGLVLPRYRLFFDIRPGDILFFNPHEAHGNPPLMGERLSVVYYVRGRLHECTE